MHKLGLVIFPIFVGFAAQAQDMTGTAPIYSSILAYPIAAGFVSAYEAEQDGSYISEFVPEGQSVEAWQQMITVTGARDLAAKVNDPKDFAISIGQGFQSACPDTFIAWDEGAVQVTGATSAYLTVFACGDAGGVSEMATILVAKGPKDVFTMQWAERGPAISDKPQMDLTIWKPRAEKLLTMKICDIVAGEAPPYPSCTG